VCARHFVPTGQKFGFVPLASTEHENSISNNDVNIDVDTAAKMTKTTKKFLSNALGLAVPPQEP